MDANSMHSDDLNDMERRLGTWKPTAQGLDDAAMLFAAGRASVPRGGAGPAWPIVTACLALAALTLGVWLAAERSERLALLAALEQRHAEPAPAVMPVPFEPPTPGEPPADGYLALRRDWEEHPTDWATRPSAPERPQQPPTEPTILRAWQPAGPIDPL